MTHQQFNNGFIFNQVPNLISKGINCFASESDLLVKIARIRRQDSSITHDQSIFRKIRNSEVNDQLTDELYEFLKFDETLLLATPIEDIDLKSIGAWFIVQSMINGFKASRLWDNEKVNEYLDFIYAHCELEKKFIAELQVNTDINQINVYLEKWLLTKSIGLPEPTVEKSALYICNLAMYFCALIEICLEKLSENDVNNVLNKVLPQYKTKNGQHYLIPSSEILLEKTKTAWAKDTYGKDKLSWNQFFRDILKAQYNDETLKSKDKKYAEIDTVDPDIQAIKKRFERWRKGELFTFDDFRAELAILRIPYSDTENDIRLLSYFLVNIFTFVQSDLMKNGLHPSKVSDLFSSYDDFKKLIHKRFYQFQETGVLSP